MHERPIFDLIWLVGIAVVLVILVGLIIATLIHLLRRHNIAFWVFMIIAAALVAFMAFMPRFARDFAWDRSGSTANWGLSRRYR